MLGRYLFIGSFFLIRKKRRGDEIQIIVENPIGLLLKYWEFYFFIRNINLQENYYICY